MDELTIDDLLDAISGLTDEELEELRSAVSEEIADREAHEDLDEEEDEEDFDE